MTTDEKRTIRREYINYFLQQGYTSYTLITDRVRLMEFDYYGQELNVY